MRSSWAIRLYVPKTFQPKRSRIQEFVSRFSSSQGMVCGGYLSYVISIQTFLIETSAHTLCFAALLLALYPDTQEKVLQEITNLWPNGAPTLDSFTVGRIPLLLYVPWLMLKYGRHRHLKNRLWTWWGTVNRILFYYCRCLWIPCSLGIHNRRNSWSHSHVSARHAPWKTRHRGYLREGKNIWQAFPEDTTRSGCPD